MILPLSICHLPRQNMIFASSSSMKRMPSSLQGGVSAIRISPYLSLFETNSPSSTISVISVRSLGRTPKKMKWRPAFKTILRTNKIVTLSLNQRSPYSSSAYHGERRPSTTWMETHICKCGPRQPPPRLVSFLLLMKRLLFGSGIVRSMRSSCSIGRHTREASITRVPFRVMYWTIAMTVFVKDCY